MIKTHGTEIILDKFHGNITFPSFPQLPVHCDMSHSVAQQLTQPFAHIQKTALLDMF